MAQAAQALWLIFVRYKKDLARAFKLPDHADHAHHRGLAFARRDARLFLRLGADAVGKPLRNVFKDVIDRERILASGKGRRDDQVLLVDKHAIAVGTPDEVLTEDHLVHAFGGRFIRVGVSLVLCGSVLAALFQSFIVLGVGMAVMGMGMGLVMPAISAGASLAVRPDEQGAVAGLVSASPALGFSVGPLVAGAIYQVSPTLAPLFSCSVFVLLLAFLATGGWGRSAQ